MASTASPRFGISTAPSQVDYQDVLRVWREADTIPAIEHAWLYDHLMPIFGDLDGPTYEGWTLLSALAAQTERLRIGVMVTSNRFRPPAMLAKIAATVDAVSGGRLEFGIGAGSRPSVSFARREYEAYGLPYHDAAHAVGSLAEACTIIRRLWVEDEPFDFDGAYYHLTGAWCNPKPRQRPHPPILIGGRSQGTLRVVAEHADVWNMPGGELDDAVRRSALLDHLCAEIGREPASISRSIVLPVSYDRPAVTRDAIRRTIGAGFAHIVLSLSPPYPADVAQWVADELISPATQGHGLAIPRSLWDEDRAAALLVTFPHLARPRSRRPGHRRPRPARPTIRTRPAGVARWRHNRLTTRFSLPPAPPAPQAWRNPAPIRVGAHP